MVQHWLCTLGEQLGLTHTLADGGPEPQGVHTHPLGCRTWGGLIGHAAGAACRLGLQGTHESCWGAGRPWECTHLGLAREDTPVPDVPASSLTLFDTCCIMQYTYVPLHCVASVNHM